MFADVTLPSQHLQYNFDSVWALQSELAMLQAEVRALADQLKDAENRAGQQVNLHHIWASCLSASPADAMLHVLALYTPTAKHACALAA